MYMTPIRYIILGGALILGVASGFQNCAEAPHAFQGKSEQMKATEERIQEILETDYCQSDEQCKVLPFGAKACGGPREFLVHSSAANWDELEVLVLQYNDFEQKSNIATGAISTCEMAVAPEQIRCVNNKCLGN